MGNLTGTFRTLGRYDEAEPLQVQVLESRKEVFGERHPETISAISNLADGVRHLGLHGDAEALEIQALQLKNEIHGLKHQDTTITMESLVATLRSLGRYVVAELLEIQVLGLRREGALLQPWLLLVSSMKLNHCTSKLGSLVRKLRTSPSTLMGSNARVNK